MWRIILIGLFTLFLSGCLLDEDLVMEPMVPADCFEWEIFDEESSLCYDPEICDTPEECYEEDIFSFIFGLFDWDEGSISGPGFDSFSASGEDNLVTYLVMGDEIQLFTLHELEDLYALEVMSLVEVEALQADEATHQAIWDLFAQMIPPEQRDFVSQFIIFTDGPEGTYGAVAPDPEDPQRWMLSMDPADAGDWTELTYTLIHEFGHLLTLNPAQVPPNLELFAAEFDMDDLDLYDQLYEEAEAACPTYFPGEGCSLEESYINRFFDLFWADIYWEWEDLLWMEEDEEYYDALDALYESYADRFVTDYAATNPAEDIAESWTAFILSPRPTGQSIADDKVRFFYEFPELVRLRTQILAGAQDVLR
jgi:hypothetical protein